MEIVFGKKFTPAHLDTVVANNWDKAANASDKEVINFRLDEIEWIALEEITFLFGWFRYLILNNKKIKIHLPTYGSDFKKHNQLVNLWGKWRIYSFLNLIEEEAKLGEYFNIDRSVNTIIDNQIRKQQFKQDNLEDDITVVPFQAIGTSGYGDIRSIDDLVINKIHKPLNLAKQVYEVLEQSTDLSASENLLLSKIVTNELFLNVIHHSFETHQSDADECYFAISLKRKYTIGNIIKSENNKKIFEQQAKTKVPFDVAKANIKPFTEAEAKAKLNFYMEKVLPDGYATEKTKETLNFYKTNSGNKYQFKNESYIEFSFLDFGQGIPNSLADNYETDIKNANTNYIVEELNSKHPKQNSDTRVLEYAFLLNSSRHPFDLEIQTEYEIPRGLYYLIDIVRRYNGLVVARSGKGKVIYDFSKDVDEIKDAVSYSDNDSTLPFFQGTLISIVLPASQNFSAKRGAAKPSFKLPDKIQPKQNHYYALIDLIKEIEKKYENLKLAKPTLQVIYKELFNSINDVFSKHRKESTLLIFDCTGFSVFPLKHKLLYFFSSSPNVNEQTSVVLLNFNDIDIISDVKNSIAFKLNRVGSINHLYKPIPIINSEEEILWIGVANEYDEAKLNELLRYESHHIAKSDLSNPEDYKGNFFNIDKYGNVTSKILTQSEIIEFVKHEK
ncbi:MAG: hypothetical protein K9I36_13095 [Bacteroidia bacterium]|nr:hypothetical protein [Bacteroidia bacterium]